VKRGSGNGASLPMVALLGEPGGGGSFFEGPEDFERRALGMGISLYGGSVRQPGVCSPTGDFETWLKGSLGVQRLSLCGSSVKGTWRGTPPAGVPENM
jgi:hypothetical protein